jgi:hypothetical protein
VTPPPFFFDEKGLLLSFFIFQRLISSLASKLRLERLRMRAALALLQLLRPLVVKLGSPAQQKEFAAEWETHDQETDEKWRSVHRQALFANVGLALSQWAGMEELLVGITSLLLRTHEANKVGIILYSIVTFNVWLGIIEELFSLEPRFITLKPKWGKLKGRLSGLKTTRDRLAHHTIYSVGGVSTITVNTSLRPSRFDTRQQSQKYQPLDFDQISQFIDSVNKAMDDLRALLNAMTDLLKLETLQGNSSEPTPD